ncbi:dTMP kinase [Patescibacteria group bacterium]|nr:dTMP kinase [Patescibacteria group bacterium]
MKRNPHPGKFIVFEGLDGSGKTTQANFLRIFLKRKGCRIVLTKEPTQDSVVGRKIRKVLDGKLEIRPNILQQLFAKDRREHLENVIIPALKAGEVVISDRYYFSSFAFGVSSGVDLEWLIQINDEFLLPDLTLILKVFPAICLKRIEKRGDPKTLFEEEKKLRKIWQTYQILPKRFANVHIIGGEKPIKQVFSKIKALLHSQVYS